MFDEGVELLRQSELVLLQKGFGGAVGLTKALGEEVPDEYHRLILQLFVGAIDYVFNRRGYDLFLQDMLSLLVGLALRNRLQ